jgi:preprotein translocase subunit YajC
MNPQNTQLLFFGVIIVVIVLLMFRNGRKRQRDQQALSTGLKPGAEIMTTFGVFGTIRSIDDAENRIVIETGPGTTLTVHRQAVGRVVAPVSDDGTQLNGEPVVLDDAASDPDFGERTGSAMDAPGTPTPEDPTAPERRTGRSDSGSSAL